MIANAGRIDGKQLMLIPVTDEQFQALTKLRSPPTWMLMQDINEAGIYKIIIDVAFDISQL